MWAFYKVSLLFIILISISSADEEEEFPTDAGVYVLTQKNFDAFLEKYPTTLVEFYAPWCGHCKHLEPEYAAAAAQLKDATPFVPLAKVDATVDPDLAKEYDVTGYPTLKWFKDGQKSDYDGPRQQAGIVEWVRERSDPNYTPPPEEVVALTAATFNDFVADKELVLVEFYAPWCGHCKKLAPELEEAAKKLKAHDPPIFIAKVDANEEANKDLAKEYGVSGFPTMKIMRKGKRSDYSGPREAAGIVRFMIEQSLPAVRLLNSIGEVKRFLSKEDVTIMGFFDGRNQKLQDRFYETADALREEYKSIGYIADAALIDQMKAKPDDIGVYYPERMWSSLEPKRRLFNKPGASPEDIEAYIRDNTVSMVDHRTMKNDGVRFQKRPLVVAYLTVDWSMQMKDGTQFWRQKLLKVANEFQKDGFHFAMSDEDEFAKELESVGLGDSGQEVNVVVFGKDGNKYPWTSDVLDEDFSEETFREFMGMVIKGKVKAFLKSQPVPKGDKGALKTVVGDNFNKIVGDESKDALIEFYAPWCGHCKSFEPKFKAMAEKLAKTEKNLVLAKMDATANDAPGNFKVEGFPTLYFAPKGKKTTPIKYEGNRDEEDLMKFMRTHAVASFTAAKEEL